MLPPCATGETKSLIFRYRGVTGEYEVEKVTTLVALLVMNDKGDDEADPAIIKS